MRRDLVEIKLLQVHQALTDALGACRAAQPVDLERYSELETKRTLVQALIADRREAKRAAENQEQEERA